MRLAPLDVLVLGLLGLRTRKLRAALSALGISIGVATMMVVTGIPASSQRALMDEMTALGSTMPRVPPFSGQAVQVELPEESINMVRRIKPVTEASAVANTHAAVRRSDVIGDDDLSGTGLSVLATRRDVRSVVGGEIFSGRFFSAADEQFPRSSWATGPPANSASGKSPRTTRLHRYRSTSRGSP
ncbi:MULTISPECIES: ABC transporter permease [unclassified Streptomyces]|uniref:ABC transporter permease n=1 Tax=unclassified Streptomyces TaxID=2593676 RepID=UPI00269DE463